MITKIWSLVLLNLLLTQGTVFGSDELANNVNPNNSSNIESLESNSTMVNSELVELLSNVTLIILLIYVTGFCIIGLIFWHPYLESNPAKDMVTKEPRKWEDVQEEYDEWARQGNFSVTLAGFAIAVLVFVFTAFFGELKERQQIIEFLSMAFVFEMISVFLYRHMVKRGSKYYASIFQFAGILALLNGFFVFLVPRFDDSIILKFTYIGGYIAFFVLTIRELYIMIDLMITWKRKLKG